MFRYSTQFWHFTSSLQYNSNHLSKKSIFGKIKKGIFVYQPKEISRYAFVLIMYTVTNHKIDYFK